MRTLLALCKPYLLPCGLLLSLLLAQATLGPSTLVCGVASAQPAGQQPDPAARQAFEDGRTFYDHGRFADALRKFQESYAISNNPKLLFNIGRAADSDGELRQAYDAYTAYLQRMPDADNREFVEARVAKLKAAGAANAPANAAPLPDAPGAPPAQVDAPIDPYPPAYVSPGQAQPAYAGPVTSTPPAEPGRPAHLPGRFRLYGGLRLGVGGTMHVSADDETVEDFDLNAGIGGQLGAELVPARFFGIGFETRFISFKEDMGGTRDLLIDLAVKPSFRLALRRTPLEFYAALPIGVTIPVADDPNTSDSVDFDYRAGANLGFMAGTNLFFSPHLGMNVELGVLIHWYGADAYDTESFDEKVASFNYTLTQFTLLTINVVYAL